MASLVKPLFRSRKSIAKLSLDDQLRAYALKGDAKMVAALLAPGGGPLDVLSTGIEGKIALDLAKAADMPVVVLLLENHMKKIVKILLEEQLHEAAMTGDYASAERILSMNLVDVDSKNDGVTSLYLAAGLGHTKTVEVLIKHGADVCLTSSFEGTQETPACRAMENRFVDCVVMLIAAAKKGKGNPFPEFNAMIAAIELD